LEKKDMKFVVSLLSFLSALVAFGLVGCGRGGDVLVEFNDLKITKEAYMKRMETLDAVAVRVPQGQFPAGNLRLPVASPISHQTLQRMLAELALLQAAKDEGVAPSKEDIERRKELYTKIDPNYITQRKEIGMSISDIDYYIELELARENLLKRGTPEKTLEDVEKYIKEHPDEFRRPPMVTLRYIIGPFPSTSWIPRCGRPWKTRAKGKSPIGSSTVSIFARSTWNPKSPLSSWSPVPPRRN
jgi:hypothetical protein